MSYGLKKKTFSAVRGIQGLINHYTKGQKLVAEAVDPKFKWGPETSQMDKIAKLTQDPSECHAILNLIWDNIGNTASKKWRKVYKNLLLLEHLLTYGSENCVRQILDNVYRVRALSNYIYKDKNGNDQGVNVRKRSAIVADLATDEDLKDVRARAAENKSRYTGMSSGSSGFGYSSGSGYSSSNYSGYSGTSYKSETSYNKPKEQSTPQDNFVQQAPPADLVRQDQYAQQQQQQQQMQQMQQAQVPSQIQTQAAAPASVFAAPQTIQPQQQQQQQQTIGWTTQQPQAQPIDLWGTTQPAQIQQPVQQAQPVVQSQPLIDLFGPTTTTVQPQPTYTAPQVSLPPMNSVLQAQQQQRQADPFADLFGTPTPAPSAPVQGGSRPLERNQAKSPLDSLFDM